MTGLKKNRGSVDICMGKLHVTAQRTKGQEKQVEVLVYVIADANNFNYFYITYLVTY